jgi:hypothetical protein
VREIAGEKQLIVEERWKTSRGIGCRPQLSTILPSLSHFANYAREEFEASLDERMIVNSFASLNRTQFCPGFELRKTTTLLSAASCMSTVPDQTIAIIRSFFAIR